MTTRRSIYGVFCNGRRSRGWVRPGQHGKRRQGEGYKSLIERHASRPWRLLLVPCLALLLTSICSLLFQPTAHVVLASRNSCFMAWHRH